MSLPDVCIPAPDTSLPHRPAGRPCRCRRRSSPQSKTCHSTARKRRRGTDVRHRIAGRRRLRRHGICNSAVCRHSARWTRARPGRRRLDTDRRRAVHLLRQARAGLVRRLGLEHLPRVRHIRRQHERRRGRLGTGLSGNGTSNSAEQVFDIQGLNLGLSSPQFGAVRRGPRMHASSASPRLRTRPNGPESNWKSCWGQPLRGSNPLSSATRFPLLRRGNQRSSAVLQIATRTAPATS